MYENDGPQWAEEQYLGSPTSGDFSQGHGVSTSQLANPNVTLEENHPQLASGPAWTQSPGVWVVVVVILIATKLITEKGGEKSEFASVRIGFESWFVVGLLAASFIYAGKVGTATLRATGGPIGAIKQFFGAL